MLVKVQYAASWLLMVIVQLCSSSSSIYHDYIVVGAGPSGLQLGYFLERAGRDYVILERGSQAGSFFEQYPRHDTLISINKRHTGKTNVEFNMRHDWNSLVTDVDDDEAPRRFGAYSRQMFPRRQELVTYLNDFATKSHLKVVYDTDVTNITRISSDSSSSDDSARFTMTDQRQQIYNCRTLIVATGMWQPVEPRIEGAEFIEGYETVSTNPDDFEGQSVLILGRGNSAFEVAQQLYGSTNFIHMISRSRVRLSWSTHYVGDLRAVNNALLDTYQLKSLDGVIEVPVERMRIRRRNGKYYVFVDGHELSYSDTLPYSNGKMPYSSELSYSSSGSINNTNIDGHELSYSDKVPYSSDKSRVAYSSEKMPYSSDRSRVAYSSDKMPYRSDKSRVAYSSDKVPYSSDKSRVAYSSDKVPYSSDRSRVAYSSDKMPYSSDKSRVAYSSDKMPYSSDRSRVAYSSDKVPYSSDKSRVAYSSDKVPYSSVKSRVAYSSDKMPYSSDKSRVAYSSYKVPYSSDKSRVAYSSDKVPYSSDKSRLAYSSDKVPYSSDKSRVAYSSDKVPYSSELSYSGSNSNITDDEPETVGVTAVDYDNFALREPYDRIIRCLGFKFNESLFSPDMMPTHPKSRKSKYPKIDHGYESADYPGLYYAGAVTHSLDLRKSAGGFIHGFRYTAKALHRLLEWKNHGVPWPASSGLKSDLLTTIMRRINEASGIYQMNGILGDVVLLRRDTFEYLEEFPIHLLYELPARTGRDVTEVIVILLQYGTNFYGPGNDVFRLDRATGDADRAHLSNFLHPVFYYYDTLPTAGAMETRRPWETLPRPARLHHMVEDFLTSWTAQLSHVLPLQRFLSAVVGRDVRSYFGDSCLLASLTHAVLPESCQQDFVQGHGLHRPLVFHSAATKDI